jgi:hypothetical protein
LKRIEKKRPLRQVKGRSNQQKKIKHSQLNTSLIAASHYRYNCEAQMNKLRVDVKVTSQGRYHPYV